MLTNRQILEIQIKNENDAREERQFLKQFNIHKGPNYSNLYDWDAISKYQNLSENFIRKHFYKLNLNLIIKYQKLSESFIIEYFKSCNSSKGFDSNIHFLIQYQKLSENFIEKYILSKNDNNDIMSFAFFQSTSYLILKNQNVSEEFIMKHINIFTKDNQNIKFMLDNNLLKNQDNINFLILNYI